MDLNHYIQYWDCVIDEWLGKKGCTIKGYQKEYDVWLNNNSKISQDDIPEPFWGYPEEGSVIIINYNPAGGFDNNPFTSKSYATCSNKHTFINYVYRHKYSDIAKPFPLIYNNNCSEEICQSIDGYQGSVWWKKKQEWIESWTSVKGACPFVMELCGWHSKTWKDTKFEKVIKRPEALQHIQDTVVSPLINAINRTGNVAICIGKQFGMILLELGFCEITDMLKLSTGKYVKDKGWQPCDKKRYYRIFRKDDIYVVNTWSVGGNRHPAKSYFDFEKELRDLLSKP